jgi:hypothetical protein
MQNYKRIIYGGYYDWYVMSKYRREVLQKLAATGIGLGTTSQVVGATARKRVDVRRALQSNPTLDSTVDSDSKKLFHNADSGKDPDETDLYNCAFAGSTVKILDVFKTETYGWQAYVGMTGSSATRNYYTKSGYPPQTWGKIARNQWSTMKWLNGDDSYAQIDPEEGYRGFYPKSGSAPLLPGWVEPAFTTSVSLLMTAARVNPFTSATTTITLGSGSILDKIAKEDGEQTINNNGRSGLKVRYDEDMFGQEWWSVSNQEMSHYGRIATRMGDPTPGVDLYATSSHSDGLGDSWGMEYGVHTWAFEDGGHVSSMETKTLNRTFTAEEKEKYGIVDVSGRQVDDPHVQTTSKLESRIARLAEEVDGELTKVALDAPTRIEPQPLH